MLVIVKIAGQQFKVTKDQTLYVPFQDGAVGDKVEFSDILLTDNSGKLSVGDKVIAFKMKRRKGFRKKKGHRTVYTQIKVTDIA